MNHEPQQPRRNLDFDFEFYFYTFWFLGEKEMGSGRWYIWLTDVDVDMAFMAGPNFRSIDDDGEPFFCTQTRWRGFTKGKGVDYGYDLAGWRCGQD